MIDKPPPSVLVVEDHPLVGEAVARLLREKAHLVVAAVAMSGEEALLKLAKLRVDLVLVDVSLPTMSGIDLVEALQVSHPHLPCLMLSGHVASIYVLRSMRAGARGYILKGNSAAILEGVQRVLDGQIFLSKELRSKWDGYGRDAGRDLAPKPPGES